MKVDDPAGPPRTGTGGTPSGRLRPAVDTDRDRVLGWRNHPQVRHASFDTAEITQAEHAAWWLAVRGDPARRMLIYEWGGRPAGVVTYNEPEPPDGSATCSFYLDVAGLRQEGTFAQAWIGAKRAALEYGFDIAGFTTLHADVIAWNTPVLDLHRQFGFRIVGSYARRVGGRPQAVLRTELTAAEWRVQAR